MGACRQCPRNCDLDRARGEIGFCGVPQELLIARAALHPWEEPFLSGARGSGTIFFCGCNLRCVFCQNKTISRGGGARKEVSIDELSDIMLALEAEGAHNINLVTPTHFADKVAAALTKVKHKLNIPAAMRLTPEQLFGTEAKARKQLRSYLHNTLRFPTNGVAEYLQGMKK